MFHCHTNPIVITCCILDASGWVDLSHRRVSTSTAACRERGQRVAAGVGKTLLANQGTVYRDGQSGDHPCHILLVEHILQVVKCHVLDIRHRPRGLLKRNFKGRRNYDLTSQLLLTLYAASLIVCPLLELGGGVGRKLGTYRSTGPCCAIRALSYNRACMLETTPSRAESSTPQRYIPVLD